MSPWNLRNTFASLEFLIRNQPNSVTLFLTILSWIQQHSSYLPPDSATKFFLSHTHPKSRTGHCACIHSWVTGNQCWSPKPLRGRMQRMPAPEPQRLPPAWPLASHLTAPPRAVLLSEQRSGTGTALPAAGALWEETTKTQAIMVIQQASKLHK